MNQTNNNTIQKFTVPTFTRVNVDKTNPKNPATTKKVAKTQISGTSAHTHKMNSANDGSGPLNPLIE